MKKNKTRKKEKNSRRSRKNRIEKTEEVEVKQLRNFLKVQNFQNSYSNLIVNNKLVQRRFYDEEGNVKLDIDYYHAGNVEFPHKHIWENGVRSSTTSLEGGDGSIGKDTFDDFKEALFRGEEIDFEFNGASFGIVNGVDGNNADVWYFIINSSVEVDIAICDFEDREKLFKFVDELSIDGIDLKDIINGDLYNIY